MAHPLYKRVTVSFSLPHGECFVSCKVWIRILLITVKIHPINTIGRCFEAVRMPTGNHPNLNFLSSVIGSALVKHWPCSDNTCRVYKVNVQMMRHFEMWRFILLSLLSVTGNYKIYKHKSRYDKLKSSFTLASCFRNKMATLLSQFDPFLFKCSVAVDIHTLYVSTFTYFE